MKKYYFLILIIFLSFNAFCQYSQLQLGDTAKVEYPYRFPILGAKAFEKGFDIPLPVGGMLNYFTATQDIVIPEISVGFSDGLLPDIPLTDITNIIEFGEISARVTSINIRPDLWVFPFLNVYGIFGKAYAETTVELTFPIKMKTVAELEGTSFGLGTTGAGGIGKYFFVLDGNWVWTNMSNFEKPVRSNVFSFRFGRAFKFNSNAQSNIALWAGGMRVRMDGITEGTITLKDVLPPETWVRRDEVVADYRVWYDNLKPLQQPILYKVATDVFNPIVDNIESADGSGTVQYRLKKAPKQEWNMIIGGQYQLNPHHQFRAEGGVVGNRKSLLLSYNYRWGFKRKAVFNP